MIGRAIIIACLLALVTTTLAQFRESRRAPDTSQPIDRGNIPTWPINEKFSKDIFTFARLKYTSSGRERSSYAWWTDYADADLNLSYRLQQLTALKVNPDPKVVEITDPELFNYPWVFMSGAGNIILNDVEVTTLRRYLGSGGFIMVDDFWGQTEWEGVAEAFKKILPEREPEDLPRSHQIFHCVFNLPDEVSLQTPNIGSALRYRDSGTTWEDNHQGGNTRDVHFRAIFDAKGRMMVMFCHNTDNGDGWEEEGGDPWFFTEFSEKKNYPLAINVIFYAMTH